MIKKLIGFVFVVIALGVGAYFYFGGPALMSKAEVIKETTQQVYDIYNLTQSLTKVESLEDLLEKKKTLDEIKTKVDQLPLKSEFEQLKPMLDKMIASSTQSMAFKELALESGDSSNLNKVQEEIGNMEGLLKEIISALGSLE